MSLDLDSIMKMPAIGQVISHAIEEGRLWGETFLSDSSWWDNKDKMANHAIYESTLWSVGNGIWNGLLGIAGIPTDIAITLYSQVKLSSTLFTIYRIDTTSPSTHLLVLAAAAVVTVSELANHLGTLTAKQAIQKALLSIPRKTFTEINKVLGIKLISKTGEKTLLNIAKIIPGIGCVIGGTVNGVMMNACGHSVVAFIKAWKRA
jgi:hypothetical protein